MVYLPQDIANQIILFGQSVILDENLHTEVDEETGEVNFGREDEPHVTVLYGLTEKEPSEELTEIIEETPSFVFSLGKISLFEQENYDVVKVGVDKEKSPSLMELNRRIAELPNKNEYKDYSPHVTIACVKTGSFDPKPHEEAFSGVSILANSVTFSAAGSDSELDRKTKLFLGKPAPSSDNAAAEIISVSFDW